MKKSNLVIDSIVYEDNIRDQNLFTVIAPSFKGEKEISFFSLLFAWYVNQVQKEEPRKLYVLDVTIPYGKLNGWPMDKLEEERRAKLEQFSACLDLFNVDYEILDLEKELSYPEAQGIYVEPSIKVDRETIEAARKVSYEGRINKDVCDEELVRRFRKYERLRKVEYSLITKKYNAMTIKQSVPEEDELFDVSVFEKRIPRIYLQRPKGSKIFRPKDELCLSDTEKEFKKKLEDPENLIMAAAVTKGYDGMSIKELDNWIRNANENKLKENAKKAQDVVEKVILLHAEAWKKMKKLMKKDMFNKLVEVYSKAREIDDFYYFGYPILTSTVINGALDPCFRKYKNEDKISKEEQEKLIVSCVNIIENFIPDH